MTKFTSRTSKPVQSLVERDPVLHYGTGIIPTEAKGGEDKSAPSFKKYIADHHPEHALRFSKRGKQINCYDKCFNC